MNDPSPERLPGRLAVLSDHLWHGIGPDVRIELGRGREPGWRVVERYQVFPGLGRAQLLLPVERRAAAGALTNYRGLRPARARHARGALGAVARMGLPVGPQARLRVLVRADRPLPPGALPLPVIATALGTGRLLAAVGIRDQANGKATLQLIHPDGQAAGYAKLGWSPVTDAYVRTEATVLRELAGHAGAVRVPRLLALCDYAGHPVVVTEPLPAEVRAVRGTLRAPSSAELHDLSPLVRTDRPSRTGQLTGLRARLDALEAAPTGPARVRDTAARARLLLDRVEAVTDPLPVAARWHGDLTPWNCARDAAGTLWVWDWETSEPDALAGLDALHWAFGVRREGGHEAGDLDLGACLDLAAPHLVAFGLPRSHWATLARVYAAVVLERACTLAVADDGWERLWIHPDRLAALAERALRL